MNDADYNKAGLDIVRRTSLDSRTGQVGGSRFTYQNLNCIFTHPKSGAKVFIENLSAAEMAVSNGMYGHELVTAISQITNQGSTASNRNNNVKSKSPQKSQIDPWGKIASSNEEGNLGQPATNDANSSNANAEGRGYNNRSNNASTRSQNQKANVNNQFPFNSFLY